MIVSVAVPVQRFRAVRGALLLSTQGGDIDHMVAAERLAIFTLFLIAVGVMVVLSILLARHHRRRRSGGSPTAPSACAGASARASRFPISPTAATRSAHLSGALRDMTSALYSRIEAIESFAADVAHELKNPLTSLRSAVETLPLAKTPESRRRGCWR